MSAPAPPGHPEVAVTRLVFTGTDGAGKSTQIRRTAARLTERGLAARRHNKWDVLERDAFPECRFLGGPAATLRACIAEMEGEARALFLFWLIATTADRAARDAPAGAGRVDLIDGYWYKHAAAELALGCSRPLVDALGAALPPPDHVLYLRVDPERALARKAELTRYECGLDPASSPASFLRHQRRLQATLDAWADERGWTVVDANRGIGEVAADVDRWVDRCVDRRAAARSVG